MQSTEQPEQWCSMLFGKYKREEDVVRRIKKIMMGLTDWKSTRSEDKYIERVMRSGYKLLRVRPLGNQYESEFIEMDSELFDYKFRKGTSITDPKQMFEMLGYFEVAIAEIVEEVFYNDRFQVSVHFHKGNETAFLMSRLTTNDSALASINILEIRETGYSKIDKSKRLSTILMNKLIEERLVETDIRPISMEEKNERLRPKEQDQSRSSFAK